MYHHSQKHINILTIGPPVVHGNGLSVYNAIFRTSRKIDRHCTHIPDTQQLMLDACCQDAAVI